MGKNGEKNGEKWRKMKKNGEKWRKLEKMEKITSKIASKITSKITSNQVNFKFNALKTIGAFTKTQSNERV